MGPRPRISDLDRIEVSDLLRMLAVVQHGSINRSASALNTTQPTLTRRIRRLEAALGQNVLERTGTGVCLTNFGRHVAEQGRKIEDALVAIVSLAETKPTHEIRLGATHSLTNVLVPHALRAATAANDQVEIVAIEGAREILLSQLREGSLDLLLAPPDVRVAAEPAVTFKPLFWTRLSIIAHRGHSLATKSNLSITDLARTNWVLFSGPYTFQDQDGAVVAMRVLFFFILESFRFPRNPPAPGGNAGSTFFSE